MVKKVGLIKGRHALPPWINGYIYDGALPSAHITDNLWLTETAKTSLKRLCIEDAVVIYVTGLTQALIATLNVCRALGIKVFLMHYDRETKGWWQQEVV